MTKHDRLNKLAKVVEELGVAFGDFTLASGAKSSYYIDCRKVVLSSMGANLIAECIADKLFDIVYNISSNKYNITSVEYDAIGGPAMGANAIVGSALSYFGRLFDLYQFGELQKRGFYVRKEAKDHGKKNLIEGDLRAGDKVVLVEDVATSGGSLLYAADEVEKAGGKIVKVIVILDRLAGAADAFTKRGYDFQSLLTINDLNLTP